MAGTAAFERANLKKALAAWKKALSLALADAEFSAWRRPADRAADLARGKRRGS